METTTLQQAIEHFDGNKKAFADALGVTRQAINLWRKTGKIPVRRAKQVEKVTGGAVTMNDIINESFNTPEEAA